MPPSIRIDSWDDWTRVYNDPAVWRPLIDAICVQEGIAYQQLHPASANTNAVFLLDHVFAEAVAETPCSSFPRRRESILHIWSGLDSRLRGNDENGAIKGLRNSLCHQDLQPVWG